jgi:NAD(P)-dependent dehydrogenase (short-subunit alcohol dehydrogenase family)
LGLLENKVALITGGTSGIGAASAVIFAKEGASVVVTGRRRSEGNAVVASIAAAGGKAVFVEADLSDVEMIPGVIFRAVEAFGRLDVAFNNAGTGTGGPIESMTPAEWSRVIDINMRSAYFCLQAEATEMKRNGSGAILFNGSVLAGIAMPGTSIYSASKGGITALARAAAAELGPHGIRVNSINPSITKTPLTLGMISKDANGSEQHPFAPSGSIPLGRLAEAEEIAHAAAFMLSDRASYINGHALVVDGGQSIQ